MSNTKIDIGNDQSMIIKQGVGDVIAGINKGNDFSRISAYSGPDQGVHTGSSSPTLARGGKPFKS